jgi:hypothetical protein
MTRPCPLCRTNGADYDDPQGLCAECVVDSRDDGADECRGDGAGEWREDVADNTDFNHQSQIERHEA